MQPENLALSKPLTTKVLITLYSKYLLSIILIIFFVSYPVKVESSNNTLTKITLQLKWYHQFQFAGYYTAKEKGFYKDAGLDIEISEGGPNINVQDMVVSGKADFGVLGSELIILRSKGLKIVMLAPIMQHSIRTIIARKDKNIASPHDLIGKKIMLNKNELPEFQAMFLNEGVNIENIIILNKNITANNEFISGTIDAINGSQANQPYLFKKNNIPFNLIKPINYGIDFYGDTLFTTEDKVKKNPKLISMFMKASFKGWKYAFDHPDEIINVINKKYNPKISKEHLNFEHNQLRNLINPDLVEIGHNNPERWFHIKDTYQKLGIVSPDFSLKGFFYKDYLQLDSVWIKRLIVILVFVSIISAVVFLYNFHLRKNVRKITKEIQDNREYLKITLSSIGDAVISVDLAGSIVTMNPVAEKLTGYTLQEAQGMELTKVFHIINSKTREIIENPINKVLKKGRVIDLANHTALISKDGTQYQISDSCAPIKDDQGNIVGVVIVFQDMSEEYQHLEQIESLGKFPSENPHPVMRVTLDGILRYANKGSLPLLKFWGCKVDEPIPEKWSRRVSQAMEADQINLHEETIPGASLSLAITPAKEMNYVNIYGMDITEQKEHFARFKTVMDSLDALVYVADMKTYEILFINKYGLEIWGDIRGKICWQSLQSNQTEPCSFCTNDQLIDSNLNPVYPVIWEFQNTVTDEWYECRDQAIQWMDGRIVRMEIATNISQRKDAEKQNKKLEEALRQSQKMEAVGNIAGGIAHDFNNILSIIIGNTELAMDDIADSNPAQLNLKEIKTASMRAKDIVKQLLSFSRKTELTKKVINIHEIAKESITLIRASIPTSIELNVELSDKNLPIEADPTQIHQVLINLCTNGAHAMVDNGGILNIRLTETLLDKISIKQFQEILPGHYAQLTISDTGHGIYPSIIEKIFDPYFTTKEVGKGTGMGLSIVMGIVKNHHGVITVYSEPNKGTTFNVFFPIIADKDFSETKTLQRIPTGSGKIIFVDDEVSIMTMGSQILDRLGYDVFSFTDPLEALQFFKSDPFKIDLIITDMTMPGMTGDLLAKEVLNIRPGIPVILCSGFNNKIDHEIAKKIGIRHYIDKPFNKHDLVSLINELLS